ncbi:TRM11 family SAM-dependent methyltransferase [Microtetraspora malaysiensis]|uniref:TRM11 family SAM-dependent methyltransferase n=1 Tax=Microtetraspora malaysiensis TaxID=161358 RepID=UPI003D8B7000
MLRIADRPLHRRQYRQRTIPGSLHPPLAAAMARMADIRPGHTVVDPCCGAGTLLLEAATQQPRARVYGFDLNVSALRASRENAAGLPVAFHPDTERPPTPDGNIDPLRYSPANTGRRSTPASDVDQAFFTRPEMEGLPTPDSGTAPDTFSRADLGSSPTPGSSIDQVVFARADAGRLPMPDGSVDRILSNPPWGGQVAGRGLLSSSTSPWWAELRRVLAPGATAVVLIPDLDDLPIGIRHQLIPAHLQRVRVSGAESYIVRLVAAMPRSGRKASPKNERTPL